MSPFAGVYLENQIAGEEVSSTYEGRHATFLESQLTHPAHIADNMVDKGDPVFAGDIVGVAFKSASLAADLIAIDTEGIWYLTVYGRKSDGSSDGYNAAIAIGDPIYIAKDALGLGLCTLSGQEDPNGNIPFGYSLGTVGAGLSAVIPVKVHWSPAECEEILVGTGTAHDGQKTLSPTIPVWMRVFLEMDEITSGARTGINIRLAANKDGTTGELVVAEIKAINDQTGALAKLQCLKLNVDNKTLAGGATMATAFEVVAEGAGTAPAERHAGYFHAKDQAGTKESLFKLEEVTTFGTKEHGAGLGALQRVVPWNVAGTLEYMPLYALA